MLKKNGVGARRTKEAEQVPEEQKDDVMLFYWDEIPPWIHTGDGWGVCTALMCTLPKCPAGFLSSFCFSVTNSSDTESLCKDLCLAQNQPQDLCSAACPFPSSIQPKSGDVFPPSVRCQCLLDVGESAIPDEWKWELQNDREPGDAVSPCLKQGNCSSCNSKTSKPWCLSHSES